MKHLRTDTLLTVGFLLVLVRFTAMVVCIVGCTALVGCTARETGTEAHDFPVLSGDYLGQPLPGSEPELFAPGIVSTGMYTRDLAMTPDGNEIYFCVAVGNYRYTAILVTKRVDGRWTQPEVAPFSDNPAWLDLEPCIAPDGQKFFFLSNRPGGAEGNPDIWAMDRQGDHWGEPYNLGRPINSDAPEYFPSVTHDGTLYFTRADPQTGVHKIFRSQFEAGTYQEPEELGPVVNSGRNQFNAFIAPDESYLIVSIIGREDSIGGADYYICFRDEHDVWTGPVNLGEKVNSTQGAEWSPFVSPDGHYFFFMASRTSEQPRGELMSYRKLLDRYNDPQNGNADIYWMKADFFAVLEANVGGGSSGGGDREADHE